METPITIALYLGLRRSEVIGLRWRDVDFDNDTISISNTIVRTKSIIEDEHTKSLASKRILSMHPALKQHLLKEYNQQLVLASKLGEDYQDTNSSVTHVCVWKTNGKQGRVFLPCYISKHFHALLEKNELPVIRFHELRHTAGSILINSGASIKQVQKYLGHEKASVTLDTYIHINQSKHKESSDLLGNQLSKTC
jgi:integrase